MAGIGKHTQQTPCERHILPHVNITPLTVRSSQFLLKTSLCNTGVPKKIWITDVDNKTYTWENTRQAKCSLKHKEYNTLKILEFLLLPERKQKRGCNSTENKSIK